MNPLTRPFSGDDQVRSRVTPFLYGALVFLMLLGQWQPLTFIDVVPEPWILVLSEAAAGRYRFGTDVVFTSGPLVDVYTRLFNPSTFAIVLVVVYGLVVLQAAAFTILAARSRLVFFQLLLLATLFSVVARDTQVMLTPFLFALIALGRPAEPGVVVLTVIGAVASSLSTLIKFSMFPLSIGLFLLVDLNRLRLRAIPVATVTYATALYVSFFFLAPKGSDFFDFLSGSLETSFGYTAAMSIDGPWGDIAVYAVLIVVAISSLVAVERRRAAAGGDVGWNTAGQLLATALFVWLTFKIGFVRHDLHVLTAFSGFALAICAYGLSRPPPNRLGRVPAAAIAVITVMAGFQSYFRLSVDPMTRFPLATMLGRSLTGIPEEVSRTASILADPAGWYSDRVSKHKKSRTAIAETSPVLSLDGTVDALPAVHSGLLAAGLAYQPRPTIQEYTTYTRVLIERNRAFFTGVKAPDYFVFEPYGIDDRYPALAEGPLWPEFLSRYAPSHEAGGTVILRRRPASLGDVLLPPERGIGRLGAPLPIPFGDEPLFVSIDVRPTVLGRLAEFLIKPPLLYLEVTLSDGKEQRFRFIPAIAREGFIATPLVKTSTDFVLLAAGARADEIAPVAAMRLVGGPGSGLAYGAEVTYTVQRLDRAKLTLGRDWPSPPGKVAALNRARALDIVRGSVGRASGELQITGDGLFAHPPRRFPIDVAGKNGLTVGFGMRPETWKGGTTDGVCFRVLDAGAAALLWERCLDPVGVEEDRALQQANIELPARTDQVILETDCRKNCDWDWAYWSDIAPIRR